MKIHDIVLIGLFSAIITAGKLALNYIPNVEIVTLLFIVYTISLGKRRSLLIALVFVTTEIFIYGVSTWVLAYYILWPLLIIVTSIAGKRLQSEYVFAMIAGAFGITFGLFFALFESFFYGWAYGITYWIRGIPWDIIHGASNYVVTLILFKPLRKMLTLQMAKFSKGIS